MVALPEATPVTMPDVLIEANEVLLLFHVPPVIALPKVVVEPAQSVVRPVIEEGVAGSGLTVMFFTTTLLPQLLLKE